MSENQRDAVKAEVLEVPEGQLRFDHYVTTSLTPEAHQAFSKLFSGIVRNKAVAFEALQSIDSAIRALNFYSGQGSMDPMAFSSFLGQCKFVHDKLQSIGELQYHQKYIDGLIDKASALHDNYYQIKTQVSTPVEVKAAGISEGADFHLSKAYYDKDSRKWIQRKVKKTDSEKSDTYEKGAKKIFKATSEPQAPVKESNKFSFSDFLKESELNSLSRLQPAGDVFTNQEDEYYDKKKIKVNPVKTKPKFQTKIQADPLSS